MFDGSFPSEREDCKRGNRETELYARAIMKIPLKAFGAAAEKWLESGIGWNRRAHENF